MTPYSISPQEEGESSILDAVTEFLVSLGTVPRPHAFSLRPFAEARQYGWSSTSPVLPGSEEDRVVNIVTVSHRYLH